ncbi:MAG: FG-GAP repeat domain-containing protein [Microthrixaceae bacterium]
MVRRTRAIFAVVACVALATVACSGGDDSGSPSDPQAGAAAAPEGLPTFTEVAEEAGFTETQSDFGFDGEQTQGAAAAVADVDGDGALDVFLPRVGKPNGLYMNDGDGTFTDVAAEAGVAGPEDRFGSRASAFFDIDADGDLDLFTAGAGGGIDAMYVNNGDGTFIDEAAERGLLRPVEPGVTEVQQHGVAVADVNLDGAMDLLVAQWRADIYNGDAFTAAQEVMGWEQDYVPSPCETAEGIAAAGYPLEANTPAPRSALYMNDGSGHFTDRATEMGLGLDKLVAFTPVFADFDGDSWLDLAVTGDGCTSRLYRNDSGAGFTDITASAGVGTDENGMGSVVRDVNGDGLADWFVSSIFREVPEGESCRGSTFSACSGNRMYIQESAETDASGGPVFSDETDALGVRDSGWGWGAAIEDFTNSGSLDLVVTNGFRTGEETSLGNGSSDNDAAGEERAGDGRAGDGPGSPFVEDITTFMVRDENPEAEGGVSGDAPFTNVSELVGITDTTQGHALVAFDMDSDGDLDILIARANDTPLLYRNDTADAGAWLTVALEDTGPTGNTWGDGARIEIYPDADSGAGTDTGAGTGTGTGTGAVPLVDWIGTSGSYESQRPPVAHRGFGERTDPIERIDVFWPGETTPQSVTDVELNQHLTITRD